ncbi:glypican-3 isoform X1 [Thunnus albacares]|uniref:glypican-3 isoform X2 n=1 Tax=Thunnus maccoyii TaxID=8240 RepID=UPI001C4B0311|nr:glypican-3 isoform X2 [Thunnus maccoyii]XP_044220458.1 glypican-3 isoform X1 [Thunnus albacares]
MVGLSAHSALFLCAFLQLFSLPGGQVPNCQEVRTVFQSLHPGSKWVPETPVSGADLQVCQTKGPSCCSKKMEERYQVAARSNMESGLQVVSGQLKRLIIQNAAIFQEAFDLVLRHGRNSTLAMLKSEFPSLGSGAQSSVGQLFLDMSLYILGSDSTVDHMVAVLYGRLFPLTYRRLLGGSGSSASEECVRGAWKDSGAFGPYPKLMMTRLSRSLLATRVFLQALNLGIEVVNTTDHLRPGRDCSRALLKLWYCPHCQGMLGPPACRGFCQAVMQGCLGGAAEVQPHWRSYVDGLGKLAGAMRGEQDMEAVVLRLPSMIKLALKHAVNARTRLSALVSGMCGHTPQRASRSVASSPPQPPAASAARNTQPSSLDADETLAGLRREFISSLKRFSSFYSGLGEALCSREPAPANHSLCWNGQEMTDRFASPGLKRSNPGSESRSNKPPEPVISQIIDKLKHINQLLRLVTVSEKRWRARSRGGGGGGGVDGWSDEGEEGFESGDCDDEDECTGVSGLGPPPRRKRLRIFADLADNLAMDDFTFQEQLLTPRLATAGVGGVSSPAVPLLRSYLVPTLPVTLALLLLCHH